MSTWYSSGEVPYISVQLKISQRLLAAARSLLNVHGLSNTSLSIVDYLEVALHWHVMEMISLSLV
jgi:hypothetical protein